MSRIAFPLLVFSTVVVIMTQQAMPASAIPSNTDQGQTGQNYAQSHPDAVPDKYKEKLTLDQYKQLKYWEDKAKAAKEAGNMPVVYKHIGGLYVKTKSLTEKPKDGP